MHVRRIVIKSERFPTREFYPYSLPVIQKTGSLELSSAVTLFVGENGSGKSTLLEATTREQPL